MLVFGFLHDYKMTKKDAYLEEKVLGDVPWGGRTEEITSTYVYVLLSIIQKILTNEMEN